MAEPTTKPNPLGQHEARPWVADVDRRMCDVAAKIVAKEGYAHGSNGFYARLIQLLSTEGGG